MRQNIDGLVEAEMPGWSKSAGQGPRQLPRKPRCDVRRGPPEDSRRGRSSLAAERSKLLSRLKTAEIGAQVQRLIWLRNSGIKTTENLPKETRAAAGDTGPPGSTQDQRDVKQLFLQLVETLADVRNWDGPVAAGAGEGSGSSRRPTSASTRQAGQHLEATPI